MKRIVSALLLACASAAFAFAWDDHGELTWLALGSELYSSDKVLTESLREFLEAERSSLPALLSATETKVVADYPDYPRRPADLAFTGEEKNADLVKSFVRAIRVNPRADFATSSKPRSSGKQVLILDVLAEASDEPGLGMDKGLFTDKPTALARSYAFGRLPHGSLCPISESTEAFQMSFMQEDSLIKLSVPCTHNSLPEARFELYTALSRFAFRQGHPYWGYRFAGWALYYVQEIGNPYNASLLPGKSGLEILWFHYLGSDVEKQKLLIRRANRKALLEDYLFEGLIIQTGDNIDSPLHAALKGRGRSVPKIHYRDGYLDDVVSKGGFDYAGRTDHFIAKQFPAKYVIATTHDYQAENGGAAKTYFPYRELRKTKPAKARVFEETGAEILASIGATSRAYIAYVRDPQAVAGVRHAALGLRLSVYLSILFMVAMVFVVLAVAGGKNKAKKRKLVK